jgi:hypothetical protein
MTGSADDLSDLVPALMGNPTPLWEGSDPEFANYVHETFGVPRTIQTVTITPRVSTGRSAVAVGGQDGAVVFVITQFPATRQLKIHVAVMGPPSLDPAIMAKAHAADFEEQRKQIVRVATRHLPEVVVLDLLAPQVH